MPIKRKTQIIFSCSCIFHGDVKINNFVLDLLSIINVFRKFKNSNEEAKALAPTPSTLDIVCQVTPREQESEEAVTLYEVECKKYLCTKLDKRM